MKNLDSRVGSFMWGKFLDGVDADGLLRSYVCLLEDLLAEADAVCVGDKAAQLTYVCTGGPPPMNYIKKLHPMMEANYPERLAKTILYPVPWAMRIVVNSFLAFLPSRTRNKFELVSSAEHLQAITGFSRLPDKLANPDAPPAEALSLADSSTVG